MKLCLEGAKPVVIAHSFKSKRKICPYLKGEISSGILTRIRIGKLFLTPRDCKQFLIS